jgi:homoserine kinase type II
MGAEKSTNCWREFLMESVFLLQHLRVGADGVENIKTIGIYRSRSTAIAAIERLGSLPGFCNAPSLIDPTTSDYVSGFYLDTYPLDKSHWVEGFGVSDDE